MDEKETIYKHIINTKTKTECIFVYGDTIEYIEYGDTIEYIEKTIKTPIFYTVCDLLSVNFEALKSELLKTTDDNEMVKIFYKYHPLLTDINLMEQVRSWHYYSDLPLFPLNQITSVVEYIDKISTHDILSNPDVFSKFAKSCCLTNVLNYIIETDLKIDNMFNNFIEEKNIKNYSVEWFLERLKFEKILDEHTELYEYSIMADSLIEFICSCIYYILSHDITIKRCENCNKFFVAYNRSDTLYCDRQSPQEKNWTCKEYSSKRGWYEKQKGNEVAKLYRNIYQKKQMYLRRHPELEIYKTNFENFKIASKEWKKKVKNGIATENEYLQWLKDVKEKKVTY